MSEFKAKTEPDLALLINQKTLEFYNNCANVYDGYRNGANMILTNYYAPLLQAYTTTRAELAQVRKERDSANYKLEMLELMINELPQNRPLYCDSGAWTVRSEDLETIYFNQDINETFYQFITRVFEADNMLKHLSEPAAPDNLK